MARKVLISFLGTGSLDKNVTSSRKYIEATYEYNGRTIKTSFVTKALDELFKPDVVFVFGTMKSMWEALWMELDPNPSSENVDQIIQLGIECEKSDHNTLPDPSLLQLMEESISNRWHLILIHYGWKENEIEINFDIFKNALASLQNDDEIILDITHSFRSLPIFANTAIDFINTVNGKNLKVVDILYGMLDIQKEFNGITPIVSLGFMAEIQNWTKGGYTFLKYGESELICQLLDKEDSSVSQKLTSFSSMLAMNYMHELKEQINILKSIKASDLKSKPSQLVIPEVIQSFIDQFRKCQNLSQYQFELANWHFKNQNYALSYLCFVESLVTLVCEKENLPTTGENHRKMAKDYMKYKREHNQLHQIWKPVNKTRNRLAHVIGLKAENSVKEVQKLKNFLKEFKKLIYATKPL